MFRMVEPDRALAEEFRRRPIGHHSPELQRLLNVFRGADVEGKHILVCTKPHEEWVIARLQGPGEPPVIEGDQRFRDIHDAEWEVFKRRWRAYFGETLPDA